MSSFWSNYIIILTLLNIVGCLWLIKWASKKREGEANEGEVTGHVWDGNLEELNNPMPRWWLWLFYISIIYSVIYLVIYPGLGNVKGVFGWSQVGQYEEEIERANEKYEPLFAKYSATPLTELVKDKKANEIGQRLFLTYCSTCHGSDAKGARGYPNLSDNDWLYGGTPEAIKTSILDGRQGMMPAMGAALGGEAGVDEVANYVMSLSGRKVDTVKAEAGKAKFEMMCAACHQASGEGNFALGAANLTDKTWLYGSSAGLIKNVITEGRTGKMPAHKNFLGEDKSHLLAAYVYSLSQ
ncbi:Cytochrome c oxidase (cbb3-type) subunit CcoP [hydrothermal vent metagenome]|uniref:Cytochrome c oxidase subunit III n=1 Tax=hydrothermal vent metagenome TaxID=652676 RepID=A0A3B1AIC1_9ZZZZ